MKRANTMSTITVELTIKVKPNSLLPMQKRPMDSSHHRCRKFSQQPHTPKAKTSKATEEKTTATTKGNRNPRHHKDITQEAHRPKDRTQRDYQIRPKQTGRRKRTREKPRKHKANSQPPRQEAKRNTTTKEMN